MTLDTRQSYPEPTLAVGYHVWVDISAPIKLVFDFLSRQDALTRWWASTCQSDPRPGGRIHFGWQAERETTGDAIFRRFEPPNLIVWEWTFRNQEPIHCDGSDHRGMRWPALCEFQLATLTNQKTRVHVHDWGVSGNEAHRQVREATQEGWMLAVSRLKKASELAYRQIQARKIRSQASKKERAEAVKEPGPKAVNQPTP